MHPNPAYRTADADRALAFVRARGFGLLTLAGPDGPLASHLPFALSQDGARLEAHVVRSNPIARALRDGPAEALLAVSGPDGYVSPDWYGLEDQVPTWNYVAVHLRGTVRLMPAAGLRDHLGRLAAAFEPRIAGKPPWTHDKMTPAALERLERAILPVEMAVRSVESTWKLAQNKTEAARLSAAAEIEGGGIGAELAALAALMRDPG